MNPRLVTPAMVVVCFAAAFGLTSWRAGLWQAAAPIAAPPAPVPGPTPAVVDSPARAAPATAITASIPQLAQPDADAEPPDNSATAAPAPAQPVEPSEFLALQDRAATHSSRSR
jgi:hypothetical protein